MDSGTAGMGDMSNANKGWPGALLLGLRAGKVGAVEKLCQGVQQLCLFQGQSSSLVSTEHLLKGRCETHGHGRVDLSMAPSCLSHESCVKPSQMSSEAGPSASCM